MSYLSKIRFRRTPQSLPLADQVPNSAGGHAWAVDEWTQLRRFLVLGTEGGSFYASEHTLTRERARAVQECLERDGPRTVAEIVAVSRAGRAPKNDPAIFALAMAAGLGDEPTRQAALAALPDVCRTGTHLFHFATFVEEFRGWGRALRRAVGAWYTQRTPDELAHQAVKYRQRDGVSHRDLLRLAHPGAAVSARNPELEVTREHAALFEWIVRGGETAGLPRLVEGFARAQATDTPAVAAALIREYGLPREALRTEHLTSPGVWEALLEDMPITALIRNLATLTRVGVVAPGSAGATRVRERFGDAEAVRRARVHPIAVLAAQLTYGSGRGLRGGGEWNPVGAVIDALDGAFYAAFGNVEPAGGRTLLALDVSGSMAHGHMAGVPSLTPRVASAALALVTVASEPHCHIVGFFAGPGGWTTGRRSRRSWADDGLAPLAITPGQRLEDALATVEGLPFGGTDCALPMLYAQAQGLEVDTFVIYTDSETWAGDTHPVQALREYRRASGIDARLVVVGMVSNGFSIADPADAGMLDVVGFDTATPQLVADFARGAL
jgi:60 kDa SS-A/Ro ribonucleoprotein